MWGYSSGFDDFQHPGPVLCVNEGDTVTVILHNTLPEATSIAFPGQTGVLADGIPAAPELNGSGRLTSLTTTARRRGRHRDLHFVADHPGTFLYESGTDPEKQVRMGLFGALIVRPRGGCRPRLQPGGQPVHADRGVHGPAVRDRPVPAPARSSRARPST